MMKLYGGSYSTTAQIVYRQDEESTFWYPFLMWTGPDGEQVSVPLADVVGHHIDGV